MEHARGPGPRNTDGALSEAESILGEPGAETGRLYAPPGETGCCARAPRRGARVERVRIAHSTRSCDSIETRSRSERPLDWNQIKKPCGPALGPRAPEPQQQQFGVIRNEWALFLMPLSLIYRA